MVRDYILPALNNPAQAKDSDSRHAVLHRELALSAASQGVPGTTADSTDAPRL
jgi:hypothetical protein